MTKDEWLSGSNGPVPKARLNPDTQKQFNSGLGVSEVSKPVAESSSNGNHKNSSASSHNNTKTEPTVVYEQSGSDVIINAPFVSVRNKVNEANRLTVNFDQPPQQQSQTSVNTPQTPVAAPVSFNILREKKPQNNSTLNVPTSQSRATKTKSGKVKMQIISVHSFISN